MSFFAILNSFGIYPLGLVHVGANSGQEVEDYAQHGVECAIFVEPIPREFEKLARRVAGHEGYVAEQAVCTSRANETITFNIASNNGQSSSIFELGAHGELYPNVKYVDRIELQSTTVDLIVAKHRPERPISLIVLDVQGAELLVLKGAETLLSEARAVYCEVSETPLYEGGCTWPELVEHLHPFGFRLKNLNIKNKNWGMALFVRPFAPGERVDASAAPEGAVNLALQKPARQSSVYKNDAKAFGNAGAAVNGRPRGLLAFHTERQDRPWWEVDLLDEQKIDQIVVHNRLDAARERAFDFVVKVAGDDGRYRVIHRQAGRAFGGVDGAPARIDASGQTARYVRIELAQSGYLHLDQIEVLRFADR